jgi:hypothetical protein
MLYKNLINLYKINKIFNQYKNYYKNLQIKDIILKINEIVLK